MVMNFSNVRMRDVDGGMSAPLRPPALPPVWVLLNRSTKLTAPVLVRAALLTGALAGATS